METNTGAKAWFNIQTGITGSLTGSNATITSVGSGWYRCALYFTSSVASGPQNIQYNLADTNGNLTYAGVLGTGSYLWGAQFENGNVLGPYRATTTVGFTTGSMLDQMKFNLKNSADTDAAFRLTYSGSWNGGYSGVKGNGINTWADTKINASSSFAYRNLHMSDYSRNLFGGGTDMGIYDNPRYLWLDTGGDSNAEFFAFEHRGYYSNPTGKGYCVGTILNTLPAKYLINNQQAPPAYVDDLGDSQLPNANIYIGALNLYGSGPYSISYSARESAFITLGNGLTDYEAKALYWIVQKYQTTLGRQVY
jgi:hypothetical protein